MGRVLVNAGRSRSCGVEVALRSMLLADRLQLAATYGYTQAVFTNYNLGTNQQGGETIDYTDNRVPYVPEHTFSASVDFRQPLQHDFFHAFSVGADVRGAGSVMWNEANTFSQDFYCQSCRPHRSRTSRQRPCRSLGTQPHGFALCDLLI